MAENLSTRSSNESFLPAEHCTINLDSVDDPVDRLKVSPDTVENARILRDGLESVVRKLLL